MKVLLATFTLILICFIAITAKAQMCSPSFIYLRLKDANGEVIQNAQIELSKDNEEENKHIAEGTRIRWLEDEQQYLIGHDICGKHFKIKLKISAEGFKPFEGEIDFNFKTQKMVVKLKRIDSDKK